MIYIKIPKGMKFERLAKAETGTTCDSLTDENGNIIDLQCMVQRELQHNTHREKRINTSYGKYELVLYLRRQPPDDEEYYLEYHPNCNGKEPSLKEPTVIKGHDAQKFNPAMKTRYGEFWDKMAVLSRAEKREVYRKRAEQREDRRHQGDSPSPT